MPYLPVSLPDFYLFYLILLLFSLSLICLRFQYVGAGSAAYCSGMSIRESSVIAALMNTRGLVELIVLNLGVSAGILSTKTFSVMVVMCLVTTFMVRQTDRQTDRQTCNNNSIKMYENCRVVLHELKF